MSHSKINEESTGDGIFSVVSRLFPKLYATAGVIELCERNGCYWFLDIIGSGMFLPDCRAEEFQVWSLHRLHPGDPALKALRPTDAVWQKKHGQSGCLVCCTDGNQKVGPTEIPEKTIYRQQVPFTDFPESYRHLYAIWQAGPEEELVLTVMLPDEY